MQELRMFIPTYYGNAHGKEIPKGCLPELGEPWIPVLIQEAEGIRIVLGSHSDEDSSMPDIQIERRPKGWAIFLHPLAGSDPSGFVYFHDDGRSFVVPEEGQTQPITQVEYEKCVELVDSCDDWKLVRSDPSLHTSKEQFVIDVQYTFLRQATQN